MSRTHPTHQTSERLLQVAQQAEAAIAQLREAGYKNTRKRQALLEILLREHGPFSVEDLQQRMPIECDLATIYRNIAIFEEQKMIVACDFGDGLKRYEWAGDEHEHHHHIICQQCRKTDHLDLCFVGELEKLVREKGYTAVSHRLEFYGICQRCQRSKSA